MDSDVRLASARGRGLLIGTILGTAITFLDGTVVNIALPHIGADLDSPLWGLQWTVNAYLLPLAAFVLLGGALGDRFGRRRLFIVGLAWFTAASVLCGFAPNIATLVAARALQGVGAALLTPGSLALIQSTLRHEDRARAIGLWAGFAGVSGALGPLVGGYLIDAFTWRWIFFINVPLAVVSAVVVLRCVPESRDAEVSGRFDVAGALLGALGLGAVTYALVESSPFAGVLGAVLLGLFVWRERRAGSEAMMPTSLFGSVEFSVINIVTLFVYAALGGYSFFFVLQLQQVSGFTALQAGLAGLPMTILMLLFSSRAGALGARIGARLPLTVGATLAGIGTLLLVPVGVGTTYWADVFGPVLLSGIGLTLLVAPLTATVLAAAPDHLSGVASGISNAVARCGSLLAVAALPLIAGLSGDDYEHPAAMTHSYRIAMTVCAGLLAVGAVLAFTLLPRRGARKRAAEAAAAG